VSRTADRATPTPRLSVILPAWNAAATIERALGSVLDERGVDLECVVIDDASTDGTADLVQAVADRDERVVLIRLAANGGVSNARNRGLAAARGEWLAFQDADDRMLPAGIARLMRPTVDRDVRAVIGQRIWTDGERSWLSPVYDIPDIREAGRKSIATHPGLLYYAAVTGKLYHRSLIDDLWFEGRLVGDQAWTIRALLRAGDGIEVIADTVFEWWRPARDANPAGITATSRSSAQAASVIAAMAVIVFAEVAREVDARIDDPATRSMIKRAYFGRLIRSDLRGQVAKAVERRDPDTAQLLDAITAFICSVPPAIVADSAAALTMLVRRPALRWSRLDASARSAYWKMIGSIAEVAPGTVGRLSVPIATRPAFALATIDRRATRNLASGYLTLLSAAVDVVVRIRVR
jgi:glycosyltransferase involved in cell wall biosynthesis